MRYHQSRIALIASIAVLPLLSPAASLAAQDSKPAVSRDTTPRWTTGATYFRFGRASLGLDELNASLLRNGRPTFSNSISTFGFSAHARRGRLLYGASVEQSLPRRAVENGWTTKLAASGASLDAGFALVDVAGTSVYSTMSLGIRSTSLHFEQRGDFTYSEGLQDPARALDLGSRTGLAQIGVTAERHFETRRTGMFALSVQTGMARPLGSPNTLAGENRVGQTPGQTSGRYVRVALGKPLARRGSAMNTVAAALLSMIFR